MSYSVLLSWQFTGNPNKPALGSQTRRNIAIATVYLQKLKLKYYYPTRKLTVLCVCVPLTSPLLDVWSELVTLGIWIINKIKAQYLYILAANASRSEPRQVVSFYDGLFVKRFRILYREIPGCYRRDQKAAQFQVPTPVKPSLYLILIGTQPWVE